MVGAKHEIGTGVNTGAAYVFVRGVGGWNQQAKFSAADGFYGDCFGVAVALSGDTAVIGAPGKSVNGVSGAGAAYVFVRSGTNWKQQSRLSAADIMPGDYFGSAVALSASTALVGAFTKNGGTGAAYVFVRSTAGWTQQAELTAADGAPNDQFGFSLALSGSTAVVGAWNTTSSAGAAYVFVRSNGAWSQQAELTAGAPESQFGFSVALSGATAVVGAPNDNDVIGAAYVFGRSGTSASAGRG